MSCRFQSPHEPPGLVPRPGRSLAVQVMSDLEFLGRDAANADVVVTHHLPSNRSVAPMFQGSPLNCFFVCEVESAIGETAPQFWIHGHSHVPCDYRIGPTRIVCNPLGYPDEPGTRFDDHLVLKVRGR